MVKSTSNTSTNDNNVNFSDSNTSNNASFSYNTNTNNQDFNESVNRALDQTKDNINRSLEESRSQIPQYNSIVNTYQQQERFLKTLLNLKRQSSTQSSQHGDHSHRTLTQL